MRWFLISFFLYSSIPLFSQKKLVFVDKSYEEEIRTVQLYPAINPYRTALPCYFRKSG